jgi:predicted ester cyclase
LRYLLSSPVVDRTDERQEAALMTSKIERQVDGHTTTFRLIGHLHAAHLEALPRRTRTNDWRGGRGFCPLHGRDDTCRVHEATSNEMSPQMSLREQAERLFTALNAKDFDTAAAMISPSVDIRTPMGAFTGGRADREWIAEHFRAFPDMYHEIRGIAVESDQTLAFEWRATGPLAMPGGEVPPTGKTIGLPGADFWRCEGGLIVAYHLYFDRLAFLAQLGLAPTS